MKLESKLVQSMEENNVIEQDEIDVYRFGVQLLSETVLSFVIFMIIAALFGSISEFIIFTVAFALLRQYAGGFHADKFISCLFVSCGIVTAFCIAIHIPDRSIYVIGTLAVISLILILLLSPVDSKYKPVSDSEKRKYRKNLILFLVIEIAAAGIIVLYSIHFAMCIFFSWLVLAGLLFIGKIKNQ